MIQSHPIISISVCTKFCTVRDMPISPLILALGKVSSVSLYERAATAPSKYLRTSRSFVPSHSPVAICVIFQEEKISVSATERKRDISISPYHQPLFADKRPFSSCTSILSYQLAISIVINALLGDLESCRLFTSSNCFCSAETGEAIHNSFPGTPPTPLR